MDKITKAGYGQERSARNFDVAIRDAKRDRHRFLDEKASSELNNGSIILAVIFVFGVIVTLYRLFISGSAPIFSFEYFLEYFRTQVPSLDITWLTNLSAGITDDWGLFNWFKDFLNILWKPISFLLWFSEGIFQMLIYLYSVLKYFFGIV